MSDVKVNGQPVGRMVYNADNFRRLQDEVLSLYELVTKLNAELSINTAKARSAKRNAND